MPKNSRDDSGRRATLDEFVRWARQASALKAALDLELFTRIAEGNRSLPALLKVSGLNERGARILLDALVSINLLNKTALEYTLSPAAETFLVKGKPAYYGDALLAQIAWEPRGQVARSVRSGKPLAALLAEGTLRLPLARSAATWVDWQSAVQEAAQVWEQISVSLGQALGKRALGLGAESGVRLLALTQNNPHMRAVVVDSAGALAPLHSILDPLPVRLQYEFVEGDWLSVPPPAEPFDLALVDSITPYRSVEQNIGILHRTLDVLVLGGVIVLRAPIADDDRKGPGRLPLLGLDLLIGSGEGDIYTLTEYRGMLEAAGFFEVRQLGDKPGILTARRIPPPPPPPPALTVAPDFIPPPETRA